MNKRIKKKYLSDEERKILRLYHLSETAEFYRFNETFNNAKAYASIWGEPKFNEISNTHWVSSHTLFLNGKFVSATASIEAGGDNE